MAKGYWIATYFSISEPGCAVAEYAKLAGPAIAAAGGRFLARGTAAKAYEKGLNQRVVIIEFEASIKPPRRTTAPAIRPRSKCSARRRPRSRIVEGLLILINWARDLRFPVTV